MMRRRGLVADGKSGTRRAGRGVLVVLSVALLAGSAMASGSTAGAGQSRSAATAAVTVDGSELLGVACPTTTRCFAVGRTTNPDTALIEGWKSGVGWSVLQGQNSAPPVGGVLTGVACQNAWSCFAVGGTLIERWNGTRWYVVRGATLYPGWSGYLHGVSCTSTFCLAVGGQSGGGSSRTLVERWNGSWWSRVTTPYAPGPSSPFLTSVSCPSASLCFAAGYYTDSTGRKKTLLQRWDGTSVSQVMPSLNAPGLNAATGNTYLTGVACPTTTNCVAVGYSYDATVFPAGTGATWVEQWDGTSWSNVASPNQGGLISTLNGVSCAGATTCVAVGEYYASYVTYVTLVESWNGAAWSVVPDPVAGWPSTFNAVRCPSATLCFAVGSGAAGGTWATALIDRWNGTKWTVVVNGNP
jgi:hypothetical protein